MLRIECDGQVCGFDGAGIVAIAVAEDGKEVPDFRNIRLEPGGLLRAGESFPDIGTAGIGEPGKGGRKGGEDVGAVREKKIHAAENLESIGGTFLVEEGASVEAGDVLLVLEAMKMETEITAPKAGKVGAILVGKGDAVQGGQGLIEIAE